MRAPSSSFRSELVAYGRKLAADDPALKVLDDWHDHGSAEEIWSRIKQALPRDAQPTAEEFIFLVLSRWIIAKALDNMNCETSGVDARIRDEVDRLWNNGLYDLAVAKQSQLNKFHDDRNRLLGRKKKGAARKRFMLGWSEKFKELCGEPLVEVTRVLTEIAFGKEATSQQVHGTQRPTTQRDR